METSAPVQPRPHGAAPTPTRRQRQAELRARELAAAGLDSRSHAEHPQAPHRPTAVRPATFAGHQAFAPSAPATHAAPVDRKSTRLNSSHWE